MLEYHKMTEEEKILHRPVEISRGIRDLQQPFL